MRVSVSAGRLLGPNDYGWKVHEIVEMGDPVVLGECLLAYGSGHLHWTAAYLEAARWADDNGCEVMAISRWKGEQQ